MKVQKDQRPKDLNRILKTVLRIMGRIGSYIFNFGIGMASLMAGASTVHVIFKPDTRIPELKKKTETA